jgi:hypothetical protein
MAEPKIELKVTGNKLEIISRTGQALPEIPPKIVSVAGLITAPAEFYTKRPKVVNTHLIVDRNNKKITLVEGETDPYGTVISGQLRYNKELAAFNINKDIKYSIKDLAQLIRLKRMHFEDKQAHAKALEALYKFNAKVTTEIRDEDNRKGTIDKQIKKEAVSNSPVEFKLDIAIYEGQPKQKLFVEVLADVSDAQVKFWLESTDLIELEYNQANEIIDAELERFDKNLVKLEV